MTFETGNGRRIDVDRKLAVGGEGEVFAVSSPQGFVFKKYLPVAFSRDRALGRRLNTMVRYPPPEWREPRTGHVTLAWPHDVVLQDGRFVGFLMPAVDMTATVELHRVTNPSDRRSASGATSWAHGFTWQYLIRAAANLAQAVHALHDSDVVIGDFNERNVRITRDARVTLLDCDSMQVVDRVSGERLFCRVGRPEFTPPELLNADWSKTVRHPSSDLFALAIHIYQLLLEGEHPFRGIWKGVGDKPSVPELARQGLWAHRTGGPLEPRPSAIPIGLLPASITSMFRVAFEDGAANPTARPTADDWHRALRQLEASLVQCRANAAHFYVNTHRTCPWCVHSTRTTTMQRPLPPVAVPPQPQYAGPAPAFAPAAMAFQPPAPARAPFSGRGSGQGAPPRSATRHPFRPLLAGLGLVIAIAVVAALVSSHNHAQPSASLAAGSPTSVDEQAAASNLATLLARSSSDRSSVQEAVADVSACGPHLSEDPGIFQNAKTSRESLLTTLQGLPGLSSLPAPMTQALTSAWQASVQADQDFVAWAQDENSGCTPNDSSDSNLQAATAPDDNATRYKTTFVSLWNPIASRYKLGTYLESQV